MRSRFCRGLLALSAAGAVAAAASGAGALGPVHVEVAGKLGGATSPSGEPDPLGWEGGARAGVSVRNVYAGLSFLYGTGGAASVACVGPVFAACADTTVAIAVHTLRYGLELGYDVPVAPRIALRPQLGLGNATFHETSSVEIVTNGAMLDLNGTAQDLYLEPALVALGRLGPVLLGADAGALWVPGVPRSSAAFSAHGQIGLCF